MLNISFAKTKFFKDLLSPCFSNQPAAALIRKTARQQWRLISTNLISSVSQAFCEASTLGVIFLAVEVLSAPSSGFNWNATPLVAWPPAVFFLNKIPGTSLFLLLLVLAVLLKAIQGFSEYFNNISISYFSARCRALITGEIHSRVLSFDFPCVSKYKIGDLADYTREGPEAIRIQIEVISNLIVGILLASTYLFVLVRLSPWLLLAVLVLATCISFIQSQLLPRIRVGSSNLVHTQVDVSSRLTEDFQGIRLLHTSGQLGVAVNRLRSKMALLELQFRQQARRLAVVAPISGFLPILAIAFIAGFSVFLLGDKTSMLASLVTFVLALQRLTQRLSMIAGTLNQSADNSGKLTRLNQILSPIDKQFRRSGGIPFVEIRQSISFNQVGLQYSPDLPASLIDISFSLPKGQTLALVGPSGAGKSSIADMITGLYAPTSGKILIDDVALDQLDLDSWQQRLGVVSQDTFLFNATIAENISFGTSGVTMTKLKAACDAAQATGFIESLPLGYNTVVGERGYRLSGGQRQRLSLARAILRDPELLILDEATSALDSQSELLVQQAIEKFQRTHTVLVIAHRLSTITRANEILVLDRGRVIESGSHEQLLRKHALYYNLWSQQTS
ncbi:ABC transporter ATP-binding protein [Synechococcus sp. CBW1108]|uniref:ABC transporter ATP-binding protein n=1 Tax=Synechococcus sp. CBW1108 TaxID=1353147 RepID=UPI0018CD4591|nr:ABC transporter ATP-binding protein [Synechococcus sp. CBW1108]QPN69517.1 ABC transporter ATP-binding protein [Synechococcus sp. CBW1108]